MKRSLPFLIALAVAAQPPAPPRAFRLPNGLQVQLLEDHERPLVRAELRVALEPADPLRELGLALLRHGGSGHRSGAEFDRAVDTLGLDLRQSDEASAVRWSLLARSRDQDLALGLLADLVLRPAFDGAELEAERGRAFDRLTQAAPLAQAEAAFRRAALGLPTPTEESLGKLTTADFGAWHRRALRPERAVLVLVGDLDGAQARQLASLSFGTWSADQAAAPPAPVVPPKEPLLVSLTGAPTEVRAALSPLDPNASALVPWARQRLAPAGIDLEDSAGLLAARLQGAVGDKARDLQPRLLAALASLAGGPSEAELASLQADLQARARLLPLHPAERARALAAQGSLPGQAAAKDLAARWSKPSVFLWTGDPAAFAQSATPKREARSK
jgi:hypothetical protein